MKKLFILIIIIVLANVVLPKSTIVAIINIVKLNLSFINFLAPSDEKPNQKLKQRSTPKNQVYKWTDEKGQIHFSNTPPKEDS